MDRAVKDGKVIPGEYLILEFDFSRISRSPEIENSTKFLALEINETLLDFKSKYVKYLGESFESEMSRFVTDNPAGNLRILIAAVDRALQDIHNRGDKNNPLFGVKGVCYSRLLHTIMLSNT